ncbi:MAG: hypothetical protein ABJA74_00335 [Lapillicoccus sp.]
MALTGKAAQVMGDPDQPHSYSYAPDVARALITLGTALGTTGQIWHLPVAETRTSRQVIETVYALAGRKPDIMAAGRMTLRATGLFKPEMREYLHTLYQFSDPWVVDDSLFRAAFGDLATPLDEALATTSRGMPTAPPYPPTDRPTPHPKKPPMETIDHNTARRARAALALASALAIAGFTLLGSVFQYPRSSTSRPPTSSPCSASTRAQ